MTDDRTRIMSVFGVLKNETRLRVLQSLRGTSARNALREGQIADDLQIGQSHAAQCIKHLVEAGLIQRQGTMLHSPYAITSTGTKVLKLAEKIAETVK